MKEVVIIIKEQLNNLGIIFRMSKYEEKATYQSHYLGLIWQILNPMIQIGIYYMIFGLGVNGGREIKGVPFIVWMMIGISTWFFINGSVIGASNSIYRNVGLVAKMKFPVSALPSISIASNLINYFWMILITFLFLINAGIYPSLYWLQSLYYFAAMIIFIFSFSILNATLTTLVRDYHILLQSVFRVVFFISGPIWDIENRNLPVKLVRILKLNPFYYLIEGFRDSFLSREWFWEKGNYTMIFWLMALILLIIGSHLHLKFRAKFVDYI
ncbi:ABC transporter permease [Enterococcus sp. BWB1-3]|uniref:ABC transporter permease n=1 Tax=unclassified Enterococcus TaxID=2608891 RepID=UPI001920FCD1|nr:MULTISPECIES: ABC transporter permease [unclassified Enterococcus]MBL1229938.1 ABC transporter permease [Enterococcus sp. BWB1-3]MCB5952936.1 ABC transporter permease [Enterococcus sp. BWT-B8]MCB5953556.1 ABC transporter permease [Enterococcus sp. CWB-B31]